MASSQPVDDIFVEPVVLDLHPQESRRIARNSLKTICILLLLLCLQNMAVKLMNLPLNRVIELRYCQEYYSDHDPTVISPDGSIAEGLCKIDGIQQRLAWMQGMIETFHIICGEFYLIFHPRMT